MTSKKAPEKNLKLTTLGKRKKLGPQGGFSSIGIRRKTCMQSGNDDDDFVTSPAALREKGMELMMSHVFST